VDGARGDVPQEASQGGSSSCCFVINRMLQHAYIIIILYHLRVNTVGILSYSSIQGTFGVIQGTFGVIQGTFGVIQGTFGVIQRV
jgi:hypothetical protein